MRSAKITQIKSMNFIDYAYTIEKVLLIRELKAFKFEHASLEFSG
jgi:hypothetical protein